MRTDYFPADQADYPAYYSNLNVKFALYAPTLGLSSEVAGLQNDAAMVSFLINDYKGQFDAARTGVTSFANGMLRGGIENPSAVAPYPLAPGFAGTLVEADIIDRTRALVKRIKAAPGYTEAMGRDMRIVASGEPAVLTSPVLEITAIAGRVLEIKWHKGSASGIEIYVDSGAGFPEEGRVLTEPTGKITVRGELASGPVSARVKGIYLKKGEEVGEFGPTYDVVLLG
jgi:hypothetical protein